MIASVIYKLKRREKEGMKRGIVGQQEGENGRRKRTGKSLVSSLEDQLTREDKPDWTTRRRS